MGKACLLPARRVALAALLLLWLPVGAAALSTVESQPYLLIGNAINDAVLVSNFEIGANQAAVPMPGLTLVEPIPGNTLPVFQGISGDGNVAVVDPDGQFNFSNLAIYADVGVECAGSAGDCNNGDSGTTFNTLPFPANGLTGNVDFSALTAELNAAKVAINALLATDTIDLTADGGKISGGTTTITLDPGLNVIDIITNTSGATDFLIENANFVIDGPADSSVIFRVEDDANMIVSQSALLVSDSGIGLDDVLFFSDKNDNDAHFNLSNVVVNGVAFWDLSMFTDPSEIVFNNVQGCTQVVGNKVNAGQDVRLTNCGFAPIPEPGTLVLLAIGLSGLAIAGGGYRRVV